jgi:hypothetical protein
VLYEIKTEAYEISHSHGAESMDCGVVGCDAFKTCKTARRHNLQDEQEKGTTKKSTFGLLTSP